MGFLTNNSMYSMPDDLDFSNNFIDQQFGLEGDQHGYKMAKDTSWSFA
jgi:hypothetical protein